MTSGHAAWQVVVFTIPAIAAAALGGVVAALRPPSANLTAAIQHFAAGIVFAAVSLELLPKERTEAALPVVIGFALGIALMIAIRSAAETMEARDQARRLPMGLLLVTGVDLLIDGLVLGIAFAAGEKAGILLAAALTLEVLFLALSVSGALAKAGTSRALAMAVPAGLALLLCVAAVASRLLFGALSPFTFAILLGVGIVALLYLVTEELLVEAHEVKETPWSVAAFFGGFLLFLLLDMMVESAGHA